RRVRGAPHWVSGGAGALARGRKRTVVADAVGVSPLALAYPARRSGGGRSHARPAWPRPGAQAGAVAAWLAARTPRRTALDSPGSRWRGGRHQLRRRRRRRRHGFGPTVPGPAASRASLQPPGGDDGGFFPEPEGALAGGAQPFDRRLAGGIRPSRHAPGAARGHTLAGRQLSCYHSMTAAAQVKPAPKTTIKTRSPRWMRPWATASSSAM